jgi:large subunit ribosomal protein L7Ae
MPKAQKERKGRKVAKAPYDASKAKPAEAKKEEKNPLFERRPRNFGIGGAIQPKRDLTRFVKWPHYIKLQRQRRILLQRLKVPPPIHQFSKTIDKNTAVQLFKLLTKYKPEDKALKRKRLVAAAAEKVKAEKESKAKRAKTGEKGEKGDAKEDKPAATPATTAPPKKPITVKYGLNHVTALIEQKRAKLVVIAHDVDPIELVVWLPALCRKQNVPFVIVKGKSRLGLVVRKKTATVLALTSVSKEDQPDLQSLINNTKDLYTDRFTVKGGGKLGHKSRARIAQREKLLAKDIEQITK